MNAQVVLPPETSLAPPKHPTNDATLDSSSRRVLDHMARLDFNIDEEKGANLISFHQSYLDYLDEAGLLDPQEAKNTITNDQTASTTLAPKGDDNQGHDSDLE